MRYSLDTSSLIQGFRALYPYENFPTLWNVHLPGLVASGDLRATEEVRVELERQDDELLAWIVEYADQLFVEIDGPIQQEVRTILGAHPKLVHVGRNRSGADPFVIALARLNSCAVVTEEGSGSITKPKIPDVCAAYSIPSIKLIELIREQGWMFA
jgi:hypothetical protein